MRTTLSIEDDVLLAARERAQREGRTVGQVLSDLARQALTRDPAADATGGASSHGFTPFPRRGGAVSNALIDQLREEDTE